jgi:tRNA threonylcarbamoyladenosine biosynthesis protein TsaE
MRSVHNVLSDQKMRQLGKSLARKICENGARPRRKAFVVALEGDLGAGKTQFAKGFAKGLGIKQTINSPTFVICRSYMIPSRVPKKCRRFDKFFHIDCYRLRSAAEAKKIGLAEILANPRHIVAIEWPQTIKKILPRDTLWINFKTTSKTTRRVTVALDNNYLKYIL